MPTLLSSETFCHSDRFNFLFTEDENKFLFEDGNGFILLEDSINALTIFEETADS